MVPPAELAASEAPLATAIQSVWPRPGNLLSAIALFATANTVLITVIAASRLTFSMARDGEIHGMFAGLLRAPADALGRRDPVACAWRRRCCRSAA